MSRLVSAWKDKIETLGHEFYYKTYTKKILEIFNDGPIPSSQKEAKEKGLRVSFKDFITWISRGNQDADNHWTPISHVCNGETTIISGILCHTA